MRYASRVRSLSVLSFIVDIGLRGSRTFDEVAKTRTTANIFPKLSSLTWSSIWGERLRLSLMFMHENVKEFAVHLAESPHYSLGVFFQEIALRMPKLTVLDLRFEFSVKAIEGDLCRLIDALPKLQKIVVPKYTLTSKVMEALSRKEHLGVLQFEYHTYQGAGDVDDILDWAPTLEEGAFPALYDLNLNIQLHQMISFMHGPFFPTHLRLIYLHLTHPETPAQLHAFLSVAADTLPYLTDLVLEFTGEPLPFSFRPDPPADEESVTWNTLRPVLRFQRLIAFEVRWHSALALTEGDLAALAQSWPTLERLTLTCEVPSICPSPLTLRALLPFARHCLRLRELGLDLSADSPDLDISDAELLADPTSNALAPLHFPHLGRLDVSVSRIATPERTALFLSRLLPADTTIDSGVRWDTNSPQIVPVADADRSALDELLVASAEWCGRWREVQRVLPLLVTLRAEERARRDALEREVEDLRVRCRVLEERLCLGQAGAMVDSECVLL